MGYFIDVKVWGHYGLPSNFIAPCSIMTKFGALIEFDKFSLKSPNNHIKITSLRSYGVIFVSGSFEISEFFISESIWRKFGSGEKF